MNLLEIHDWKTGVTDLRALVPSPDGRQLYAISGKGTLTVFSRDPDTGDLAFLTLYREGIDGWPTLESATLAVLSPDGDHLYLVHRTDRRITVLRRNEDGSLSFVREYRGTDTLRLDYLSAIAISPDGRFVFIADSLFPDSSVVVFRRDPATGELTFVEEEENGTTGLSFGADLEVSPDGDFLYASGGSSVTTFAIDANGRLTRIGAVEQGMPGVAGDFYAEAITVSPDGRHVYTASPYSKTTFVLVRQASGALAYGSAFASPEDFFSDQQRVPLASPDGSNVYVCRNSRGILEVYSRNSSTGALTFSSALGSPEAQMSCAGMVFDPEGESLYSPGQFERSIVILERRRPSGELALRGQIEEGQGKPPGIRLSSAVAVSPDGLHVYSADFLSNQIALFRRGTLGRLTFVAGYPGGGVAGTTGFEALALSPDGQHLYAAGTDGSRIAIVTFRRNPGEGSLALTEVRLDDFLGTNANLKVSADGRNVYVLGESESAIGVYRRNATSGSLTLIQTVRNGSGGVVGLSGPTDLAFSPNGAQVYVTARNDPGGLLVFRRDPATGRLSWLQSLLDVESSCGPFGILLASSLAVSPDGKHVYVAAELASSIHVFSRNGRTGRLTLAGCDAAEAGSLAMSPDGRFVYGLDPVDDGLTAYSRNPNSGRLARVSSVEFDSLNGGAPVVSPDNRNLYVPAGDGGLVVLSDRPAPTPCVPSRSEALCLNQTRFRVRVEWKDFSGNEGRGTAVPLTPDSGYFWFFDPANVELVVKVLDGRAVNGHFWVFYGALSNVEYEITVEDTSTGDIRVYSNPSGRFASAADTQAFRGAAGAAASGPVSLSAEEISGFLGWAAIPATPGKAASGTCVPGPAVLCLGPERFRAEIEWKDFEGHQGIGTAVELTQDTGYFWFFDPANVETIVKVLDGRGLNGYYWVFYGSLSSVEFRLRVTDTVTNVTKTYVNPAGRLASQGDTQALPAE